MAITLLTTVLFALSPALRGARADVASVLRSGRTTTRRLLPRNLIVMAQVAVCTLILMSAALLVGTLERMRSMNAGFDRDHVVTFTIDPSLRGYKAEQSRALSQALLEKDPAKQQALIKQAETVRDQADEIRKKKATGVGN